MPDNHGWAYGNNAKRLIKLLGDYEHYFDDHKSECDIAIYFDIRVYKKVGKLAKKNIVRVGGPRPITIDYGDDREKLKKEIAVFDAIITLNQSLYEILSGLHSRVYLIPNALDVKAWQSLTSRPERQGHDFAVGFAGSLVNKRERNIKGYDLVVDACKQLGVRLVCQTKGDNQIPHESMPESFYNKIDCLVHPVAPGKEGCSNVIMEALTLGVPVITTRDAGFHAELLADVNTLTFCERTLESISEAIELLRNNPELCKEKSASGRKFAERYHDINSVAKQYDEVLNIVTKAPDCRTICFVPFWKPSRSFASARLRCHYPARFLNDSDMAANLGYSENSDIVVVSQLATDETLAALHKNLHQIVIYDVCDRYYADDRNVGGVHAQVRFHELASRASVIVTPTAELKRDITQLGLAKPVVYIPDGIDYLEQINPKPTAPAHSVVWFGNPGRGNFESSRWMLDYLKDQLGFKVTLISRKRSFREDSTYYELCLDWKPNNFINELRKHSLCVISHSDEEQTKSANRLITAVANGIPSIVFNSPSCASVLRAAGKEFAIVSNETELAATARRLLDRFERVQYLDAVQRVISGMVGPETIRRHYADLIRNFSVSADHRPLKVLFVSHNLQLGEGAPNSLMQIVTGLKQFYPIEPVVYCPISGKLQERYESAGIPVYISHPEKRVKTIVSLLEKVYSELRDAFVAIIERYQIDVVLCNTAKTLPFATIARECGVPAFTVVRESSKEHIDLSFGKGAFMDDARRALLESPVIVFVSRFTEAIWKEHNAIPVTDIIPNGINTKPWESVVAEPVTKTRHRLGLATDKVILLSVGTINARKRQLDSVHAFASLPEAVTASAYLVLVGAVQGNKYLDQLIGVIEALPQFVRERIRIVEETPDVASWYHASDVFILTSENESYPRVVVEAMHFGLPILATRVFGVQEQVLDRENGFLFEPGDINALSTHMERMISDENFRQSYANRSATRFWELTTYHEMLHRYYGHLLNACEQARLTKQSEITSPPEEPFNMSQVSWSTWLNSVV
jgi:glycosyltransferase involved in cell wall biosynthesis